MGEDFRRFLGPLAAFALLLGVQLVLLGIGLAGLCSALRRRELERPPFD